MSQITRLERAKFSVMWKIVSKFASDFTHDYCDEFYMDPVWDLCEPIGAEFQAIYHNFPISCGFIDGETGEYVPN